MDSTRKNGWLKKKQTDIDVNHLITLFAKSRFITRTFILRLPHSARALSLIALLAMPLFAQATTVTPTEHQGTWENKDEDGDGVHDELDDYPFDKGRSSYEVVVEEEFNNNLAVANVVESGVPFRVHGAIQQKLDMDLFKFNSTGRKAVTVVLKSENYIPVVYQIILEFMFSAACFK